MENSINNHWDFDEDEVFEFPSKSYHNRASANIRMEMKPHSGSTANESKAHKSKDFHQSGTSNEKKHTEIVKMSDILGTGISDLFSERI